MPFILKNRNPCHCYLNHVVFLKPHLTVQQHMPNASSCNPIALSSSVHGRRQQYSLYYLSSSAQNSTPPFNVKQSGSPPRNAISARFTIHFLDPQAQRTPRCQDQLLPRRPRQGRRLSKLWLESSDSARRLGSKSYWVERIMEPLADAAKSRALRGLELRPGTATHVGSETRVEM